MDESELETLLTPRVEIAGECVRIHDGPIDDYVFELERCDTHEKLMAWCVHLCGKTWVTPRLIRELIVVVCDHYGWIYWL